MNKKLLFALACAISMAFGSVAARADVVNLSSNPNTDTFTTTSITFTNPGSVIPPITGIFAVFGAGTVTTFSPTTWTSVSGNETLTFTGPAANTATFTFTSVHFDPANTGVQFQPYSFGHRGD